MTTTRTATATATATTPAPATSPATGSGPATGARTRRRGRGQLTLLADRGPWHLDERTRRVGRAGVAEARATLRAARQRELERNEADSRAA
jgi:hypothetical protein